ncbi:carbamoyltransferase HypF [Geotalea toluenoxydans]
MGHERIRVQVEGIVQGVGFRPFVYRLARQRQLTGWVRNTSHGVLLEAEGIRLQLDLFYTALNDEAPPLAAITSINRRIIATENSRDFSILPSSSGGGELQISPDCDVCPDCLAELFDPGDRRYGYPFINCTNCGPRYSIITGVPYDRQATTMADFSMCDDCRAEYENPADRRFHAQPNACPVCGPRLYLITATGEVVAGDPVKEAIRLLKSGKIVAVKGTGGYHLAVDPFNSPAVAELRHRKRRSEKPFALMVGDLARAGVLARLDPIEERLLAGPEKPIVLLCKREGNGIVPQVAPANDYLGLMLASTPLHHLLLRDFLALVMTSGNVSDEPVAYRDSDAVESLTGIADYFLGHDRRVHCRNDDSVIRVFQGKPIFLRRSRGYVPRSIRLHEAQQQVLAVGAELKGAICLTRGDRAFMSQHLGDLKNESNLQFLDQTVSHLRQVLSVNPKVVAHDLHPDYQSTAYAQAANQLLVPVQHHHAHMASCMAENGLEGQVLGVILDGAGYGADGTIWGGEFLLGDYRRFRRVGHFSQVPLPGGDAAVREPWRMALSHCHAVFGSDAFSLKLPVFSALADGDKRLLQRMLEQGLNSPLTSSCGRLFDGAAALIGVRSRVSYEGQAAMELEALAEKSSSEWHYPYAIVSTDEKFILDCRYIIDGLVNDLLAGEAGANMALRFHKAVAAATADVCVKAGKAHGVSRVVLSGGVFQNKLLAGEVHDRLVAKGFQVFSHRLVPPNDGGLALGQAVIAGRSDACA